jgi:hypothetical protein
MGVKRFKTLITRHGVWLLVAGIVAAGAISFGNQPSKQIWKHEWRAVTDPLDTPLPLADSPAHSLRFTMQCPEVTQSSQTLLSLSAAPGVVQSFRLVQKIDTLHLEFEGETIADRLLTDDECDVELLFNDKTSEATFRVGDLAQVIAIDRGDSLYAAPRITGIHAADSLRLLDARLTLEIQTAETQPERAQMVAFFVAVGLLVLLLALTRSLRREHTYDFAIGPPAVPTSRTWPATALVAFTTICAMVIAPPVIDDGWLTTMGRKFSALGYVTNYFHNAWPAMPQGHWLTALSQLWLDTAENVLLMRSASAIAAIASWLILKRWVLQPIAANCNSKLPIYFAAVVYLPWVAVPMMTLRYEPIIVLLWSIGLAAVMQVFKSGSPSAFATVLAVGALGVIAHQTGWVVVSLSVVATVALVEHHRAGQRVPWSLHAANTVAIVGTAFTSLILDNRVSDLFRSAGDFSDARAYQKSALSIEHWLAGLNNSPNIRAFAVLGFLALFAVGLRRRATEAPSMKLLRLVVILALTSTVINASKWIWHLTVLAPVACVLAALVAIDILNDYDTPKFKNRIQLLALVASITAGIAITRDTNIDADFKSGWVLIPLAVVALIPLLLRMKRWESKDIKSVGGRLALSSVMLSTAIVIGSSWVPRLADVNDTHWSMVYQNLRSINHANECGVMEHFDATTPGNPLPSSETQVPNLAFPPAKLRGVDTTPVGELNTYTSADPNNPDFVGRVATPWQSVTDADEVVFWALGTYDEQPSVKIVARDASGEISEVELKPPLIPDDSVRPTNDLNQPAVDSAPLWILHRVQVPAEALELSIRLFDTSAEPNAWEATTVLAEPDTRTLRYVHDVNPAQTYVEPSVLMFTPCVQEPDIERGLVNDVRLIIGQRTWAFGYLSFEYTRLEVGCKEIEELKFVCAYLIQ